MHTNFDRKLTVENVLLNAVIYSHICVKPFNIQQFDCFIARKKKAFDYKTICIIDILVC